MNLTAFGELRTAHLKPAAGWRVKYNVNSRLYDTSECIGSGTVTVDANRFKASTGTTPNSKAIVRTKDKLIYLPGVGGLLRATAVFPVGAPTGSKRVIMIGDRQDGFGFGTDDSSVFGTFLRKAGVDSWVKNAAWNGRAKFHSEQYGIPYEVSYQWLRYGFIRYNVLSNQWRNGGQLTVNTVEYPGTSADVSINDPSLPVSLEAWNGSNAQDVVIYSASAMAFMEGIDESPKQNPLFLWSPINTSGTLSDGNNNHILTVADKTLYTTYAVPGTIQNRTVLELESFVLTRQDAGAAESLLRIYRNGTTTGPRSFTDYDTYNSAIETSTTATTMSGGTVERQYNIQDSTPLFQIKFLPGQCKLNPGESYTFAIQNSGTQSTRWSLTAEFREK